MDEDLRRRVAELERQVAWLIDKIEGHLDDAPKCRMCDKPLSGPDDKGYYFCPDHGKMAHMF